MASRVCVCVDIYIYMPQGGGEEVEDTTTTTTGASSSFTRGRLRESRTRCHAARDAYVAACETGVTEWGAGAAQPSSSSSSASSAAACVKLRAAYDAACPKSWVAHFDGKRAEDEKVKRVLASRERSRGA